MDAVLGHELALEQQLRQRVLYPLLNGPLQRPCAIHRVEPDLGQLGHSGIRHIQTQIHVRQAGYQSRQLDLGNAGDVRGAQSMEDHGLVDAIQKLRTEMGFELIKHRVLDVFATLPHHALDDG